MQLNLALTSVIGFLGIVIGAALQFVFNRRISREGAYLTSRFDAYLAFIKSLASKDLTASTEARLQLVAYAHDKVLVPFLAFERLGGYIKTEAQKKAFVEVVRAIRRDAGSTAQYSDDDLFYLTMFTEWNDWT